MTVGDTIQSKNGAGLGGVVTSVNGETGPVDVTASSGVVSVDGQTGVVVLSGTYLALAGGTLTGLLTATKGILVSPATSSSIGFAVVGLAGQTGNLTSWLDSSLATLASVNAAGVIAGAGFIVGSSAAATGGIRLPSTTQINWRNAANNADIGGFSSNASNQIQVATDFVPSSDSARAFGTSALRWASIASVSVSLGTNPALTGAVRLPSTGGINWRNAANSGDIGGFSSNASDQLQASSDLVPSSDSAKALGTTALRWASVVGVSGTFGGANPAVSGQVRLPNTGTIAGRNAANSADVAMVALNASDQVAIGAPLVPAADNTRALGTGALRWASLTVGGEAIALDFAPASTTGATVAARYFRGTTTGAPASGTWVAGDIVPGTDGTFWHCTVDGTPGTWVQSGSATYATLAGTSNLVDAAGDLLVGSADNTLARLAPGTIGQVPVIDDSTNKVTWGQNAHARSAFLKPTAALYETYERTGPYMAIATTTLTTATLYLVAIALPKGLTVTSISFVSGNSPASVPVNQWFGLFDSSRNMLRLTADDTSTAWAASTLKTLNLSSTFTTTYAGLHYVGIMVKATTPNNLVQNTAPAVAVHGLAPIVWGSSTSGLTNPASCPGTAGAITTVGGVPYCYVS